jgi:hypothetical protein
MLSELAVKEWQDIYLKQTGRQISFDEAAVRANRMFRWLKVVSKPSSKLVFNNETESKSRKNVQMSEVF